MEDNNIELIFRIFEKILDKVDYQDVKRAVVNASYCIIHKARPVYYQGRKGILIWDYLAWNDLTILDEDWNVKRLIDKKSDEETEREFNYYLDKYGI